MARKRPGPRWDAAFLRDEPPAYAGRRTPVRSPEDAGPPGAEHYPRDAGWGYPGSGRRDRDPGNRDTAGWPRRGRGGYGDYPVPPGREGRGQESYHDTAADWERNQGSYDDYSGTPGVERRDRRSHDDYDDTRSWERHPGAPATGRPRARHRRKGVAQLLSGATSLVLLGFLLVGWALSGRGPAGPEQGAVAVPGTVSTAAPSPPLGHKAVTASGLIPVRIEIPAIRVNASVMKLDLNHDGTVQVPPLNDHNLTGWYDRGAHPGQVGSSVILGHVDSFTGTSVFFYLKALRKGDTVKVVRANGSTAVFSVDGVQVAAKAAFPTESVYGPVKYPALHLVTCGGSFDQANHRYTDNIIVYSHLVSVIRA